MALSERVRVMNSFLNFYMNQETLLVQDSAMDFCFHSTGQDDGESVR